MPKPDFRRRIVKKRTKKFIRPCTGGGDCFPGLPKSWRKPRGIDSPTRRRYKGARPMPNIGYGNERATRNIHADGFRHFPIQNPQDLYMLLMQNKKYAGIISHTVGRKARKAIIRRASELDIRLVNGDKKVNKREV